MVQITTFPLAITQNGWTKQEQCNCGGTLKVKFIHKDYPNYILEWSVKYYAFKVTKANKTVQPQTQIAKLSDWLKTFKLQYAQLNAAANKPVKAIKTEPVADSKPEPVKTASAAPSEPTEVKTEPTKAPTDEPAKETKKQTKKK